MNIYWLVAILTLLLNRMLPSKTNKEYLINLLVSFLPLFIYGAIRVNYGNDYSSYEYFFEKFHVSGAFVGDSDEHAEVGFQYLCYIMPSFRSMLVLSAGLLYSSWVLFLYKNISAKWVWLAIILIFLMPEKNVFGVLVGIRNGMVISGFLLIYAFIQMRKPTPVLAVAVLLSTIHTSAIIYIPFAYLIAKNTPITKKEYRIWLGICVVLALASGSLIINVMRPFISYVADRYEDPLQQMAENYNQGTLNYVANIIMMSIFLIFGEKHSEELKPKQNSLIRMAALYCLAGCLGGANGRMTYYYGVFYAGGITLLFSMKWATNNIKMFMLIFAILINIYAIYVWQSAWWWSHQYYHSIFE